MIQDSLLRDLATKHDFSKANQIIAMHQAKPFVRSWLALDFSVTLAEVTDAEAIHFTAPYQNDDFIKYVKKSDSIEACEKRHASKADLKIVTADKNLWFEFHVFHQDELSSKRDINKLYEDAKRVVALRKALPGAEVMLLIGIWGSFTTNQIELFAPLDNSISSAYVLDSSLTGSVQISRLIQMNRAGEPRFLLAAF